MKFTSGDDRARQVGLDIWVLRSAYSGGEEVPGLVELHRNFNSSQMSRECVLADRV